jgi:hypothetical protein
MQKELHTENKMKYPRYKTSFFCTQSLMALNILDVFEIHVRNFMRKFKIFENNFETLTKKIA